MGLNYNYSLRVRSRVGNEQTVAEVYEKEEFELVCLAARTEE
jgi:hypothetical protein